MTGRPIRIAVLCSGSASSFRYLCDRDPNYGKLYEVVGMYSNVVSTSVLEYAASKGVMRLANINFECWLDSNRIARNNLQARHGYYEIVLKYLEMCDAEAVLLSDFMLIVTDPVLSAYEGRILNVAVDPTGSTVHIVNDQLGQGPIVAESAPLPYVDGVDPEKHQERMKSACDGPAYAAALEKLITQGWPAKPYNTG